MRILVVEPGKRPYEKEIDDSLTAMQEVVGGRIEALFLFDEPVALICNEEGKLQGLPLNRSLNDDHMNPYDVIAGTFFVCGAPVDSEDFESLTMTQLKQLSVYSVPSATAARSISHGLTQK